MRKRPKAQSGSAGTIHLAAWKLPPIVSAIAVAIVLGFYLGGPGLGMGVGGLCAGMIVAMAVRNPPLPPIVPAASDDRRRHVLLVLERPLEDGAALDTVADIVHGAEEGDREPEVLLLAPSHNSLLDRWASQVDPGRRRAQLNLVISAASLAKAGVSARARVGDEDVVQSVEDALRDYPASEVVLVGGETARPEGQTAAEELDWRLRVPFIQVPEMGAAAARHVPTSGGR
jgi:hypothetical protein